PARKEDNGKRYYSPENMLLLEKILLLRETSMSLEDIKKIMNRITMQETLAVHKEQLELQIKQLQRSLDYTNTLVNTFKLEGDIQWDQLLPLLSEENQSLKRQKKKEVMEKLFSEEERAALDMQLPKLESDSDQISKWIHLVKRIEQCLKEGKAPDSHEGQWIARDTLLLSEETFKGNAELAEKFWRARRSEETSADLNLYPVHKDTVQFMEEAMAHYEKNNPIG
ncbi:MAG: MerR family transcriptional regulator, partial [Paenibacillus sp.]|uniref:MerR family transcriptional regulator n=1 Tax=Paenibacillus sp. TaxID=58172 RepID=UPI0028FDE768